MSCDNPILKTPRIINDMLLSKYHDKPCHICDSNKRVSAHHRIKRSKYRLDIPENLVPLCFDCHCAVETTQEHFVQYLIKQGILGRRIYYNNLLYPQFYDWLTDANNDLYNSLQGVYMQEPKPKSKYKLRR